MILSNLKICVLYVNINIEGVNEMTKLFEIDGMKYQFDCRSFKNYVKKRAQEKHIPREAVYEEISKSVNVSNVAVKQWYYGKNGPSELDMVRVSAKILQISDFLILMKKFEEETDVIVLNSLQIESLKRIYDAIIDYLHDFYITDGFTGALWYEYVDKGYDNPENVIYDYAENKLRQVHIVVQKEYFYLRDTEVYREIEEYTDEDLYDIFNGKLSYAYRFEALVDGNPTTIDDYNKAIKRLNEIVEKYT